MKLKSNIEYWIEKRGYKKKYVAEKLGVSPTVLSRWINDKSMPSVNNLFALSIILKCQVDDLYKVEKSLFG